MDHATLVPSPTEGARPCSHPPPKQTRSDTTPFRQRKKIPSTQQTTFCCLPLVRQGFANEGVLGRVQEILLDSWISKTKKQYAGYLEKWEEFAGGRDLDPFKPPVSSVLDLLTELFEGGVEYNALNTAGLALSTIITLPDGNTVGTHPFVRRFMNGCSA